MCNEAQTEDVTKGANPGAGKHLREALYGKEDSALLSLSKGHRAGHLLVQADSGALPQLAVPQHTLCHCWDWRLLADLACVQDL